MTRKEFNRLLAIHGADLARWPEAVQAPARAHMAAHPDAAAAHGEQAALDRLLARDSDHAPPPDLADRILAAAKNLPQDPETAPDLPAADLQAAALQAAALQAAALPRRALAPAVAWLAASAVLGFVLGTSGIGVATGEAIDLSGLVFGLETPDLLDL